MHTENIPEPITPPSSVLASVPAGAAFLAERAVRVDLRVLLVFVFLLDELRVLAFMSGLFAG
jgi:hypothetical protein